MVAISVEYKGDLRCVARHEPSGAQIDTCAPKDNHGAGDRFSPTDLLAASLATCIATVLGIYARQKEWNLDGMCIDVKKEMAASGIRRIASLALEIWIPIPLSAEDRAKVEKVAHTCPVHMSLHPDIDVPMTFHWKE